MSPKPVQNQVASGSGAQPETSKTVSTPQRTNNAVNKGDKDGMAVFMRLAGDNKDHEVLAEHISSGKILNIDKKSNNGNGEVTALMVAAHQNADKNVRLLLNSGGANPHVQDAHGFTALIWAAHENSTACIDILLEYERTINMQDERGNTALMWAASLGKPESVKKLLDAGADPNILNRDNMTAYYHVAMKIKESDDHKKCYDMLKGWSTEPNNEDKSDSEMTE